MIVLLSIAAAQPPSSTSRTPVGELNPGKTDVRLMVEVLDFKILNLNEVQVRADYVLYNPGTSSVVRYSVPVTSGGLGGGGASSAAASVRLTDADGNFVPCLVQPGPTSELPLKRGSGAHKVSHVCTADVVIPSGVSRLRMSYEGELFFEDSGSPARVPASNRTLLYDFSGANNWAGTPDQLQLTVSLGPFGTTVSDILPDGAARDGGLLSWSFDKPDHSALGFLKIELGGEEAVAAQRVAGSHHRELEIGLPSALVDGDLSTTWCGPSTQLQLAPSPACPSTLWITPAAQVEGFPCEAPTASRVSSRMQAGASTLLLGEAGGCVEIQPAMGVCLAEVAVAECR